MPPPAQPSIAPSSQSLPTQGRTQGPVPVVTSQLVKVTEGHQLSTAGHPPQQALGPLMASLLLPAERLTSSRPLSSQMRKLRLSETPPPVSPGWSRAR